MMDEMTIKQIWEDINDAPDEDKHTDQAARWLLAAAKNGPNKHAVNARDAEITKFASQMFARRARRVGLAESGKVIASDWFDEKTGGIAFILDACVLSGMIERHPSSLAATDPA